MHIFEFSDAAAVFTSNVPTAGTAVSVVLSDDEKTAYVAESEGGVQIIEFAAPESQIPKKITPGAKKVRKAPATKGRKNAQEKNSRSEKIPSAQRREPKQRSETQE